MTLPPNLNIRRIILDRLKALGRTPYRLSQEQVIVAKITCRRFLYGRKGTNPKLELIEDIFRRLGLTIIPLKNPRKKEPKP